MPTISAKFQRLKSAIFDQCLAIISETMHEDRHISTIWKANKNSYVLYLDLE